MIATRRRVHRLCVAFLSTSEHVLVFCAAHVRDRIDQGSLAVACPSGTPLCRWVYRLHEGDKASAIAVGSSVLVDQGGAWRGVPPSAPSVLGCAPVVAAASVTARWRRSWKWTPGSSAARRVADQWWVKLLRTSDAPLHLRWSNIDLEAAELTIAGSTATINGIRVEGTTKAGRSRIVSLDSGTIEVMREHRTMQLEERLAARQWWQGEDDLVFRGQDGQPLHSDTPTHLMAKLVAKAGVPRARLHDLRHLHATTLLQAAVPVHVVAARLGHADPAITLRVYAHVLREHASGVADVFARAVDQ